MSLFEGIKGINYEIKGLYVEEGITRRLQALGLNDGTVITVLSLSLIHKYQPTRRS
ncbi:MAG: FeoA domain-containing protein [Lachnospiraceae bacterium]|nr:FeoA domain-containing protein [Lachnospiraceae bacterium]